MDINHLFVSGIADDPTVPSAVHPSNWNARHALNLANFVDMAHAATSGDGLTNATAYVGWDNQVWTANTMYFFAPGIYQFTANINIKVNNVWFYSPTGATLRHTLASIPELITFDGSNFALTPNGISAFMTNIRVDGNGNAGNGIVWRVVVGGYSSNCSVTNVTGKGFANYGCILCNWDTPTVSTNIGGGFTTIPAEGISFDIQVNVNFPCSANTIRNVRMEGMTTGIGIHEINSQANTYLGGTSEQNAYGIVMETRGNNAVFYNVFLELNTTRSILNAGFLNEWQNCKDTGNAVEFTAVSYLSALRGGQYFSVVYDSGGTLHKFEDVAIVFTGGFTDNASFTNIFASSATAIGLINNNIPHPTRMSRIISPLSGAGGTAGPILIVPTEPQDVWIGDSTSGARLSIRRNALTDAGTLAFFQNNVQQWTQGFILANNDWLLYNGVLGGTLLHAYVSTNVLETLGPFSMLSRMQWHFTQVLDANYVMTGSDLIVGYATLTAARTTTLPPPLLGRVVVVKDQSGSAASHVITVAAPGGSLIDGALGVPISVNNGALQFYCDGLNYNQFPKTT